MIDLTRRRFIHGAGLLLAAPAIVQAASLMPVRAVIFDDAPIVLSTWYWDAADTLSKWEITDQFGNFEPLFDERQ